MIFLTSHLNAGTRVDAFPGGIHGTLVFTLAVGRKPSESIFFFVYSGNQSKL